MWACSHSIDRVELGAFLFQKHWGHPGIFGIVCGACKRCWNRVYDNTPSGYCDWSFQKPRASCSNSEQNEELFGGDLQGSPKEVWSRANPCNSDLAHWFIFCWEPWQKGYCKFATPTQLIDHCERTQDFTALHTDGHMVANIPLSALCIQKPDDMPCIDDWITTCISFLFNGSRLHREPLDLNIPGVVPSSPPAEPFLHVKKGFTRLLLGLTNVYFQVFSCLFPLHLVSCGGIKQMAICRAFSGLRACSFCWLLRTLILLLGRT